ncbi:hypothetical protein Tco_0813249 [Tanacetum coccineum]
METCELADTPMVEKSKLDEDPQGKAVDPTRYRGIIDILMYLTARTINMGLWYPKDSCIALTAFADADHAGCQDTRKSTSGSMQLLGERLVSWSSKKQKCTAISSTKAEYIALHLHQAFSMRTTGISHQKAWNAKHDPEDSENAGRRRGRVMVNMNHKETQVTARDEKWVPFSERVKVSSTNVRLETTVPQKEETFQVVIDLVKNTFFFKSSLTHAYVLRNLYHQFWTYQEYGLPIPETMLTEVIKQSETYHMFIKYSTIQIPPQEKGFTNEKILLMTLRKLLMNLKILNLNQEPVNDKDIYKRRVKKKVTLSADDNIISDDPDTDLALGKFISQTEVEAARQVHATHARIVTESVPEPTKRRKSGKVTSEYLHKNLNVFHNFTPEEQEAADIMQALKESKKISKRQPGTRGSSEGTSTIPQSLLLQVKELWKPNLKKKISMFNTGSADEDMIKLKFDILIRVIKKLLMHAKADAEKTLEEKYNPNKTEHLQQAQAYSVSSEINSLLEVKIQSEVPHTQSPSVLSVLVSVISEPTVLTPVQESPLIATKTTLPPPSISTTPSVLQQTKTLIPTPTITTDALIITTVVSESDALSAVQLRVAKLEKDVSDLKKINHLCLKLIAASKHKFHLL